MAVRSAPGDGNVPEAPGIAPGLLGRLSAAYRRRWGAGVCAVRPDGSVSLGVPRRAGGRRRDARAGDAARRLALEEALRWGEPAVHSGPDGTLLWAVPLLWNSRLLGGLVASLPERRAFVAGTNRPTISFPAACADLRRLAEEHNLTNAALLESRRAAAERERERAEAIHAYKAGRFADLHGAIVLDEPLLVAALRRGDRGEARAILNRLLVGMIHRAGDRLELSKSFFMELVVTMCRTAVEAGGAPEELLGANYAGIVELAGLRTFEDLAPWLHRMLERMMDGIHRNRKATHPSLIVAALRHMEEHCAEDLTRDRVASLVLLSPSHFSRFFKKHLGQSFRRVLVEMRIDRAADLLARTDMDLKRIALETGFNDQSYLTKVFRRLRRTTPAEYRRRHRPAPTE